MVAFGPIEEKTGGYEVRCSQIVQSLADLGHEVHILEFPTVLTEKKEISLVREERKVRFVHLRGNERAQNLFFKTLISQLEKSIIIYPILFAKIQLYSIVELLRFVGIIEDCEVVFVESVFFPFAVVLARLLKKRVILDTHYVGKLQAQKYKRKYNFFRLLAWDFLERFASNLSEFVIVVSEEEEAFVKREYRVSEQKLVMIPVTVETSKTKISRQTLKEISKEWNLQNKIVVTFLGTLETIPNRDAATYIIQELAPSMYRKNKDIIFLIIGKGKERFRGCSLPNVVFTGFIKDIAPLLQLSDLCIAPIRMGSGVKTKVLEYMSYGKPVLSTPEGIRGIHVKNAESIFVSDINKYPEKLVEIISNLDELKRKGKIAEEIVRKQYSPSTIKKRISKILHQT